MKGNIKALLDLHISVGCLILRKLALFHEKQKNKTQPHLPIHTKQTKKTMWRPDSRWGSRLAFSLVAACS